MTTRVDVSIDMAEFSATRKELFQFDRELLGKLNSRIRRTVQPAADEAAARASVLGTITDKYGRPSGIARKYDRGRKSVTVKVGARTSRMTGKGSVVRLIMDNGAAAMAEFAEGTPSGTKSAAALVDLFNRRFGGPGRIAWEAVDKRQAEIIGGIKQEVTKTEEEFNDRLRSRTAGGVLY